MVLAEAPARAHEPYQVRVDEYKSFRRDGYLVVRGLVAPAEAREWAEFTDDMMAGRRAMPGLPTPPGDATEAERRGFYERIHMPHRTCEIAERFLLHPRVVDVLEALIGPDILALQTMLFFKQPGQSGQGFHQDSYYTSYVKWICQKWADVQNGSWDTTTMESQPNDKYRHRDIVYHPLC
ncbi:MAG: phytanoyl-CoA dioxygenase family protein [Chloroflexota bacterium]|nr:phytanoyl-CoA dioxygenase family protein [Chloroflexota bacterium]